MGEIAAEAVDACRHLQRAGHGTVHRCVPLKGELVLPDGRPAAPWLCQTAQGVWIAGAQGEVGRVIDVLDAHPCAWEERLLGDRLTVGLLVFSVPYGKGADARRALAMGRLHKAARHPIYADLPHPQGPWVEEVSELDRVWIAAHVDADDPILALLHTGTPASFSAPIAAGARAPWRLLITRDQALLFAVSEVGDIAVRPLPGSALEVVEQTGRNEVRCGDVVWLSTLGNGGRHLWVATLPGLGGADRLREAARLASRPGTRAGIDLADRLLQGLRAEAGPLDPLCAAALRPPPEAELAPLAQAAVAALKATSADSGPLADWLSGWSPPLPLARAALAAALDGADGPAAAAWALPFHRALRNRVVGESDDRFERTEADIALAEHLIYAGLPAEAARLLEPRLQSLPDEDLNAVLPPPGADLTAGEGGQPAHIRVLELLVIARGDPATADLSAVASLARHQPLLAARLDALAAAAGGGELSARAARARELLAPGGLRRAALPDRAPARPLPAPMVEALRHPVARSGGALARVQAAVAKVDPPDYGILRRHCERLHEGSAPELIAAVTDAAVMLGMPAVPAYLSMGERRVGVRSHEQPEPFLLIGGAHLDPASDLHLRAPELRFAVGAEVAHLRFQHSRVTSDELWAGLLDKGAAALATTAGLLPLLGHLPVDLLGRDRTWRAVRSVVPERWLQLIYQADPAALAQVVPADLGRLGAAGAGALGLAAGTVGQARAWQSRGRGAAQDGADLGPGDHRIIAAHRVMQITADRAGLVLCGDLGAAVRAMFLLQSRLLPELAVAERLGLGEALGRRDGHGQLILADLTVRVAALAAFWLSDEYARLRGALGALDHAPLRPLAPLEPEERPAPAGEE
jgi:hypothetical protein